MRILTIIAMAALMALNMSAQGRGRRGSSSPPPMQHNPTATSKSNAPFSTDRDKGVQRATDVGKGKKKGLTKHHH